VSDRKQNVQRAEWIRDGIFCAGTAALAAGVHLQFGFAWALMAIGALLLGLVLLGRRA
jgi:hypothetical protein